MPSTRTEPFEPSVRATPTVYSHELGVVTFGPTWRLTPA